MKKETIIKQPKTLDLHLSLRAREKYDLQNPVFSVAKDDKTPNNQTLYLLASKMNSARDLLKHPENAVDASELSAFDLIDEIMHYVVEAHCSSKNPDFFSDIHEHLSQEIGNSDFQKFLENFASLFPPPEILSGDKTAETFLTSKTDGISNKLTTLEEILLLWIENQNKAGSKLRELVDEKTLTAKDEYEKTVALFQKSLKTEKTGKGKKKSLIDLILEPILKYPDSLLEQLKFMEKEWEIDISPFRSRILGCVDFLKEEQKMRFDPNLFGPGPIEVADYSSADFEAEQFSDDRDWMPRVVLLAKNTYVWLHQLSEQYQRPINTLADIPDEELSILSSRGFTGLWLIGIWERSTASRKIKQMLGNPEAAASAYSLKSYSIANDIGGDEAYMNLKQRAWDKGLRLACDMVPNHMGTDSEWVAEHPDWFVSCDHPPFPSYQFTCENLSDDPRMSVYIEDGYWHKTDAAVVFKRVDNNTGQETYIYHGNDGTHLPWNDTAQLNYLLPHVREAVIQTILHVARMFPIIRFDAAMTLAKKHFHRLWFPEPGSGGDIPSRSQYGMTRPDFDKVFPAEFWREVVDRVRKEVPDSLLLAEAFWLMEGYFVRTLGMHRVYNSAFMHMLRDEENAKYRESIRNVLEFDPRILERHVNFMSNPDEDSAVAQFGNDDKYFGTCIVMATMPGLPMFGHGQIEGYAEKYGMEYRRAYLNESVNEGLVARHEYHIFPLLRKRYLFSGVYNYRLYDVVNHDGHAIEDVFAYSNRCGNEKSLVVYHNRYGDADGRIRMSVQYKTQDGNMNHTKLADGLGLGHGHDRYVILKESISNLEYLISCDELHERGLPISLGAYKALVFLDIREVISTKDRPYAKLSMQNGWQGLPGIEDAIDEMLYDPIITATENAVSPETLQQFQRELTIGDDSESEDSIASVLDSFASAFADFEKLEPVSSDKLKRYIDVARSMADLENSPSADFDKANAKNETGSNSYLPRTKFHHLEGWRILLAIPFLMTLRKLYSTHPNEVIKERFLHERFILRVIQRNFEKIGITKEQAALDVQILDILTMAASDRKLPAGNSLGDYFEKLFSNADVQRYLRVNRFKNTVYFNKERFEVILPWLCLMSAATNASSSTKTEEIIKAAQRAKKAAEKAEYQLDKFLTTLESD